MAKKISISPLIKGFGEKSVALLRQMDLSSYFSQNFKLKFTTIETEKIHYIYTEVLFLGRVIILLNFVMLPCALVKSLTVTFVPNSFINI
jgi:hypothetical protein